MEDFLNRLLETGATESSGCISPSHTENDIRALQSSSKNILRNIMSLSNGVLHSNTELASALLVALPEDGMMLIHFLFMSF